MAGISHQSRPGILNGNVAVIKRERRENTCDILRHPACNLRRIMPAESRNIAAPQQSIIADETVIITRPAVI